MAYKINNFPDFDRSKHVYRGADFAEVIKDAIRFFNGTPVHPLPLANRFNGTGVYALYYTGGHELYMNISEKNRLSYDLPIYVGKAVPKGWRQHRNVPGTRINSYELYSRIRVHSRNIDVVEGLDLPDFSCRFVIFEENDSDMIGTIEAALIKLKQPLWNTVVDGFGNHTPGKGRFNQAKSDWDVLHPGRPWAAMCQGVPKDLETIIKNVKKHYEKID